MMLVVQTQVMENYGAHDWDGEGQCPQYWKAKGGHEYKITDVPLNIDYEAVISAANIGCDNNAFREYVVSWSIEGDDYLSWFEKNQMEYDGEIRFPEPALEYSDLVADCE